VARHQCITRDLVKAFEIHAARITRVFRWHSESFSRNAHWLANGDHSLCRRCASAKSAVACADVVACAVKMNEVKFLGQYLARAVASVAK